MNAKSQMIEKLVKKNMAKSNSEDIPCLTLCLRLCLTVCFGSK